ncbi:hypothetical protein L198_01806 [Cryptococcus wingfieldii CBS 7118]|uniref:PX domain-containing protein n=1 Tax=Cryptococcus wingfieldii CBS 7118 TaxID=1295528 RepID=A0A1E3JW84_9TREE|nr:hypothetical protein L198_01806 [Cryptococcus wingfieldii CBS 7118]ODO05118.1 hypothetical protein L198_01806 [Cryptococcus wingfieldii CBS 7118]
MDEEASFASLLSSTTRPSQPRWDPAPADADPWANPFAADGPSADPFANMGASIFAPLPAAASSPSRAREDVGESPYVQELKKDYDQPDPPSVIAAREREQRALSPGPGEGVYASSAFASPVPMAGGEDPFSNPFAPASSSIPIDPASQPFTPPLSPPRPPQELGSVPKEAVEDKKQGKEVLLKGLIDEDLMAESDPELSLKKAFKKSERVAPAPKPVKEDQKEVHATTPTSVTPTAQHSPPKPSSPKSDPPKTPPSPSHVPLPASEVSTPVVSRHPTPSPLPINSSQDVDSQSDDGTMRQLTTPSEDRVSVSPLNAPDDPVEDKFEGLSVGGSVPYAAPADGAPTKADSPMQSTPKSTIPWAGEKHTPVSARFGGRGWGALDDDGDEETGESLFGSASGGPLGASSAAVGSGELWGGDEGGWEEPGTSSSFSQVSSEPEELSTEEEPTTPTAPSSALPISTPTENSSPSRQRLPYFEIIISDPTRMGDPVRGYILYTIRTSTSSPHYRQRSFSCLRRYSDFLWLVEMLESNNPGVVVPPVPGKHPWGRFEDTFVETRRRALERCLKKIVGHPILQLDPDLRLFLESDNFGYEAKERRHQVAAQQASAPAIAEKGGLLSGWTGSGKFIETDDWFESRKIFLDSLETQLKSLAKGLEVSSKHRLELSLSLAELSSSLSALAESDLGASLSALLAQVANLLAGSQAQTEQAAKDEVAYMLNLAEEYVRFIGSVRAAWAGRVEGWKKFETARREAARLKGVWEKRGGNGRDVAEAEDRAKSLQQDYLRLTQLCKSEFTRFERERVIEFKETLEKYLDGMIAREKEMVEAWDGVVGMCVRVVERGREAQG